MKPDNFLRGPQGILLSDFGITVAAHRLDSLSFQDRAGTLAYMAPEQFDRKAQIWSDQYSLALVVYEWLCGKLPFFSESNSEIERKHREEDPPAFKQQGVDILPSVEKVVRKGLAKKPEERYPSITAFAQALEQAVLAHQSLVNSTPTPVRPSPLPWIEPTIVQKPAVPLHKPEDGHPKGAEEQARGAKPASPKRAIDELREYFQTIGNPQFVFNTILYEANNGADEFDTSSKLDYRAYRLNGQGKKEPIPEKAGQGIPSPVQLNLLAFRLIADKLEDVKMGGMRYQVAKLLEPEAQRRWQLIIDTLGQQGLSEPSNLTVRAILDEIRKQLQGSNVVQDRFLIKTIYASLRNKFYITIKKALKERDNVKYDRKLVPGTTSEWEMARVINRIDISAGGVSEIVDTY